MKLTKKLRLELIERAAAAKERAYAPYSNFRVGAALLADDGTIFEGCNVENSSYGLTICAERNAIFQAAMHGKRRIAAVAVASDDASFITPCGACRQVIAEFGNGSTEIILTTPGGQYRSVKLSKLFPTPPALKKLAGNNHS
ncbi:MAG: cytidine deaminase [Acidobacteriota bacterium]